jgi:hypothetical protein
MRQQPVTLVVLNGDLFDTGQLIDQISCDATVGSFLGSDYDCHADTDTDTDTDSDADADTETEPIKCTRPSDVWLIDERILVRFQAGLLNTIKKGNRLVGE